jgi:hypothetical protein
LAVGGPSVLGAGPGSRPPTDPLVGARWEWQSRLGPAAAQQAHGRGQARVAAHRRWPLSGGWW